MPAEFANSACGGRHGEAVRAWRSSTSHHSRPDAAGLLLKFVTATPWRISCRIQPMSGFISPTAWQKPTSPARDQTADREAVVLGARPARRSVLTIARVPNGAVARASHERSKGSE